MAALTVTDMSAFEDALDVDYCHIGPGGSPECLCGHYSETSATTGHHGEWRTMHCSGCGKRNCPKCQAIARRVGY
jgi:hypothetical protein